MLDEFHSITPFSLSKIDKERLLLKRLNYLTEYHCSNCDKYSNILDTLGYKRNDKAKLLKEVPFLPIRVFKELELRSIPGDRIFKTMMSSGTGDQKQSVIILDKDTALAQQRVLLRILGDFIGNKRLPMLVIDSKQTISDRKQFTARGATIMGLDIAAKPMVFALMDDMSLDVPVLSDFLEKYSNDRFLIFGFTFMVWQHLLGEIESNGLDINLKNGYLLTTGGWKKLIDSAVSNEDFKARGMQLTGLSHYVDFYGTAEQTGCVYAECAHGHLHASIYSDVIVRRYGDFSPCEIGERGFIQLLSSIPRSYPGHSLLTEDEGVILGEDDCRCGRKGKYIKVLGRIKSAEIRGCSDTYANRL